MQGIEIIPVYYIKTQNHNMMKHMKQKKNHNRKSVALHDHLMFTTNIWFGIIFADILWCEQQHTATQSRDAQIWSAWCVKALRSKY